MTTTLTMQSVADIGFVLLVMFVCFKSLFGGDSKIDARAEKWGEDMRQLESSLRQLIHEASAASGHLDRSLQKRQAELQTLLTKLEIAQSNHDSAYSSQLNTDIGLEQTQYPVDDSSDDVQEDLPNDSWSASSRSVNKLGSHRREPAKKVAPKIVRRLESTEILNQSAKRQERISELESLIESEEDSYTLNGERGVKAKPAPSQNVQVHKAPTKPAKSLATGIELIAQKEMTDESKPPAGTDPVAYKIARRLLFAGKEIHVVARKLGLALSEVRVIDKLLRDELATRGEEHLIPARVFGKAEGDDTGVDNLDEQQMERDDTDEIAIERDSALL